MTPATDVRMSADLLIAVLIAAAVAALGAWYARGRIESSRMRARAERERLLEEIIGHAPVAIAVLSGPEHRYVSVNPPYQALKPGADMIGKTLPEVFPESAADALPRLDHILATGETFPLEDAPRVIVNDRGEPETRYFTGVLSRYDGPDGRPAGVLVVSLETTHSVLGHLRAQHEKDEFLSTVSHELKTPLTALKMSAEMIGRMLSRRPPDLERAARYVTSIATQVDRASNLVGELLDVSGLETGQLRLRQEQVDLTALVRTAVQRTRDSLSDDAAQIAEQIDNTAIVQGDESRLDQVLTNLLSNAVKYSQPGSPIEVRLAAGREDAVLTVIDHGVGISDEERGRLFQPFSRTSDAERSGVEGTGLGLYITRRIVRAHGGEIDHEHTPGGGATFTVTLPLQRDDAMM